MLYSSDGGGSEIKHTNEKEDMNDARILNQRRTDTNFRNNELVCRSNARRGDNREKSGPVSDTKLHGGSAKSREQHGIQMQGMKPARAKP